jgi:hypothetical protein
LADAHRPKSEWGRSLPGRGPPFRRPQARAPIPTVASTTRTFG